MPARKRQGKAPPESPPQDTPGSSPDSYPSPPGSPKPAKKSAKKSAPKSAPKSATKSGVKAKQDLTVEHFKPLHLQKDLAKWRTDPEHTDYSVADTAIPTPDTPKDIKKNSDIWKGLGHHEGVHVLHGYTTLPKGGASLAAYNGMSEKTLLNFVDTVVCDIVPEGLVFMAAKFKATTAQQLIEDEDEEEFETPEMQTIFSESRSHVGNLTEEEKEQNRINPDEVIKAYLEDRKVKLYIDQIIRNLTSPIFLPVTASMLGREEGEEVDVVATILAHAVQILLFAPTQWKKDIQYCRTDPDYISRYPTPDGHGGNCRRVGETFSLEDLNRSITLLYLALYRRTAPGINIHSSRTPSARDKFLGYFDPVRQKPMAGIEDDESPQQCAVRQTLAHPLPSTRIPEENDEDSDGSALEAPEIATTSSQLYNANSHSVENDKRIELQTLYLECVSSQQKQFKKDGSDLRDSQPLWQTLEVAHAKIEQSVTTFTSLVDEGKLAEFLDQGIASEAIQQVLSEKPEDEEALKQAITRAFGIEFICNGQPPPENPDIQSICRRFDIEEYPSLKLYPDADIEPLKPHQVADLGFIFEKLETLGHVFFSNEMGLGKTKVFAATIECRARLVESQIKAGKRKQRLYYPTLLVNPVQTIHQTHRELKRNFPGLTIWLYYGSKSDSKRFDGATILQKAEFLTKLRNLDRSDPETGKIVVITTYPTLHQREVVREEKRFVFLERRQTGAKPKRRAGPSRNRRKAQEEESSGSEDDWMDLEEMVSQKIKKRFDASKRVPRYESEDDPELQKRRLHFLSEDDDIQPDGNIVKYRLRRPAVQEIQWGFLIVDEAHLARRVDSIYNRTFRLLSWRWLMWVTGTPLMSGLQDILSPLYLMWPTFGIDMPLLRSSEIEYLEGLWREDYDPEKEWNVFDRRRKTRGILSESFIEEHPSKCWGKVKKFLQNGVKIWQLNPFFVERVGREAEWSSAIGKDVISAILRAVSLRRTQRSRLLLPNGEVCFPSADMLPMKVISEELTFDKTRKNLVRKHGRDAAKNMFLMASNTLQEFTASPQGIINPSDREPSINFSAYREGVLVAFDFRNLKILYTNVDEIFGKDIPNIAKALASVRDSLTITKSQQQRLFQRADKDDMPMVGVEHLQQLLGFDNNCGLNYVFTRSCLDPDVIAPAERIGWLRWLTASSPMSARIIELCHDYVIKNQKRVVVYIDTPWIQQITYATLLMAGFNTLTVRSSDKPGAKIEAIRLFCDPTSDAQVFVANINIMSTGVVLWDRDGASLSYYSLEARKLGIILSAVAKLVINSERPSAFWTQNNDWVVVGLLELVKDYSMDQMEAWLSYEEGRLRQSLEDKLQRSIRRVKVKEEEQDRKERLNLSVQARQQEPTSLDSFDASLADADELSGELDEDDGGEEFASADEYEEEN
ncbi:hypothetical protein Trihar35433_36 [Trichoderma harzianum]|nr:hypothetical protein Trihar35433_36 [Trichoderma harzianum]